MCRSIKPLFNFDPPASGDEIHAAALQYVRKVSGFQKPSKVNEEAFQKAIESISTVTEELIDSLSTKAPFRNREVEIAKRRERNKRRFG